jgi:hypothetical protein
MPIFRVIDNLKESQDGRYAKDKEEKSISVDRRSPTDSLPEPCTMFKSESHSDLLMNSLVNNEDRIYDSVDDLERVLTQAEDNGQSSTIKSRILIQKTKLSLRLSQFARRKRRPQDLRRPEKWKIFLMLRKLIGKAPKNDITMRIF